MTVFVKNFDFRTILVKIREKIAGKIRKIPLQIGKKSVIKLPKNTLQTIHKAFLFPL
nr:MAG TPA: hypothetical protein [Caudoviricetes sp.]